MVLIHVSAHKLFRDPVLNGRRGFGSAALAGFMPFLESETLKMEISVGIFTMWTTLHSF